MSLVRRILLLAWTVASLLGQSTDPVYAILDQAYGALRAKQYDTAITQFHKALSLTPENTAIHKDLAYTLLKIGETAAARDAFAGAMRLDPNDGHVALEYAFLCHETKQTATARRVFDRWRTNGDAALRATASQAFENIDRPLREGIARWTAALQASPNNFSAHRELAELAEQRDELALAEQHYEAAWNLKRRERSLLLDLGRVRKARHRDVEALTALLAASRGPEARTAEAARALLPTRYPYVYEFQQAIALDPENVELRRELAYLHLEMGNKAAAETCFEELAKLAPDDLLSLAQLGFLRLDRHDEEGARPLLLRVLQGPDDELADRVRKALKLPQTLRRRPEVPRRAVSVEATELADRSLQAGYLKDALKYLHIAHENDPVNFDTMRKLGWTYNMLHQDGEAVRWFGLAMNSDNPAIASEARRAYQNLRGSEGRVRTTVWMFPLFSTRWHDLFSYGQAKAELRIGSFPVRPYLSVRFVGDTRGSVQQAAQTQYLSESAFIPGIGLRTLPWRRITFWGEAGLSMKYLLSRQDVGRMVPDYRGGLSYARGYGHLIGAKEPGWFVETNIDALYVSRFGKDTLLYGQTRTGWTLPELDSLGGFRTQVLWHANGTVDQKRQYWANTVETGPGIRFRWRALPPSVLFSASLVRGVYTLNEGNPRRPNFWDGRAGVWYAFSY